MEVNGVVVPKAPATQTMLVTVVPVISGIDVHGIAQVAGPPMTFICANMDITAFMVNETCEVTLHTDALKALIPGNEYNVFAKITRDPTAETAVDTVSLAYMAQGWSFLCARLASTNPYRFVGWRKLYKPQILLEQWDYD